MHVVGGAAQELGLTAAIRTDNKTAGSEDQKYYSRWAVVGKSRKHLDPIGSGNWLWLEGKPDVPVWTDDYSNILRVLY